MTQVSLSVRLATSLVNLHDPNNEFLNLLVLDELTVSLDMSNRIKVVEILLTNTFAESISPVFESRFVLALDGM